MPIPSPRGGEKEQDFISRCMGDEVMNREYPKQEQRAAVCYTSWKNAKKDINIVKGADLKVRKVGGDVLLDYKGMNPAAARILGFSGCADDECLILEGISDTSANRTIGHEREENDLINQGMSLWDAHKLALEHEEGGKSMDPKAVKFVNEEQGIIEGLAAPFGGPLGGKDLQGEYFSQKTDFCTNWFKSRPILYHHGMDDSIKALVIGHDIEAKVGDNGLWIRAQLDKSVAYWDAIKELVHKGLLFFSTGAVPHLVQKATDGEILVWPWVETSTTVSPAHPLAAIDSLKAIELLKGVGATDEEIKAVFKDDKVVQKEEAKAMKNVKITCPKCKAEFDYDMPEAAGTPAPVAPGTEHAPAGDKQPAATNPGVNQGMAPETHVGSSGTETVGESGQHQGATAAPDKPEGDKTVKGETPKPAATVAAKEPEPPKSPTQASDNTATSTAKAVEDDKLGIKALLTDALKGVGDAVKEAVKPLEERIKALENAPAKEGPIRRVVNPVNPLPEEDKTSARLKTMLEDPNTPKEVRSYLGQEFAAEDVKDLIAKGPQRIR